MESSCIPPIVAIKEGFKNLFNGFLTWFFEDIYDDLTDMENSSSDSSEDIEDIREIEIELTPEEKEKDIELQIEIINGFMNSY